jgi:hypothetical protein
MKRMPYAPWWAGWYAVRRFLVGVLIAFGLEMFDVSRIPPFWLTAPILGWASIGWTQMWHMLLSAFHRVDTFGRSRHRGMEEVRPGLWTISEAVSLIAAVASVRAKYGEGDRIDKHLKSLGDEVARFHQTLLQLCAERETQQKA